MSRSTVFQTCRWAAESTPGVKPTTGYAILKSLSLSMTPQIETTKFQPKGSMFTSLVVPNKDMTSAKLEGNAAFNEIDFIFDSLIGAPTNGVYTLQDAATTPKTYSFEIGNAAGAETFSNGVINGVDLTFTRDSAISVSADMIGGAMTSLSAATASGVTNVDAIPMLPKDIDVYMDGVKRDEAFKVVFSCKNRWGQEWILDSTKPSFIKHMEAVPDISMKVTEAADADGLAALDRLRNANEVVVYKVKVAHDFGTQGSWNFEIEMPCKVGSVDGFEDASGSVYAVSYTLQAALDVTGTYGLKVTLTHSEA